MGEAAALSAGAEPHAEPRGHARRVAAHAADPAWGAAFVLAGPSPAARARRARLVAAHATAWTADLYWLVVVEPGTVPLLRRNPAFDLAAVPTWIATAALTMLRDDRDEPATLACIEPAYLERLQFHPAAHRGVRAAARAGFVTRDDPTMAALRARLHAVTVRYDMAAAADVQSATHVAQFVARCDRAILLGLADWPAPALEALAAAGPPLDEYDVAALAAHPHADAAVLRALYARAAQVVPAVDALAAHPRVVAPGPLRDWFTAILATEVADAHARAVAGGSDPAVAARPFGAPYAALAAGAPDDGAAVAFLRTALRLDPAEALDVLRRWALARRRALTRDDLLPVLRNPNAALRQEAVLLARHIGPAARGRAPAVGPGVGP